ncbi:MAG: hypothetical protein J0M26_03475 [Planctomycetes bacterium]|jgi:hypothetical protein|nr:hypothetical protein [Planctomycetota bacterium]
MIKDVVSYLDYSLCANISLVIFMVVFVAVTLRTLLVRKDSMNQNASIVLEEGNKVN